MGKASRIRSQKQEAENEANSQFITLNKVALWRRFAAMAYDSLLVVSLWGIVTFLIIYPMGGAPSPEQSRYIILPAVLVSNGLFYIWFWLHGGQTLGMRAWRIKATAFDGSAMSRNQAIARYALSVLGFVFLGISYWWSLLDKENRSLAERFSASRSILIDKN